MALILQASDFETGITKIGYNDLTQDTLETYFTDDKQTEWIYLAIGKTEGDLFIADISSYAPASAEWIAVFSEFNFEISSRTYFCIGFKEILKYLAYYEYVSDQTMFNTPGGNKSLSSEAATNEGIIQKATILHNRAMDNIHTLRCYMDENSASYPNLEQQYLPYNSPL